jgi:hypothetical protein
MSPSKNRQDKRSKTSVKRLINTELKRAQKANDQLFAGAFVQMVACQIMDGIEKWLVILRKMNAGLERLDVTYIVVNPYKLDAIIKAHNKVLGSPETDNIAFRLDNFDKWLQTELNKLARRGIIPRVKVCFGNQETSFGSWITTTGLHVPSK